jgi:hypothetical protein
MTGYFIEQMKADNTAWPAALFFRSGSEQGRKLIAEVTRLKFSLGT